MSEQKFKLFDWVKPIHFPKIKKMQVVKLLENGWIGTRYEVTGKESGTWLNYQEFHPEELEPFIEKKNYVGNVNFY